MKNLEKNESFEALEHLGDCPRCGEEDCLRHSCTQWECARCGFSL
jgi:ribosomal protein L37AE/L43A